MELLLLCGGEDSLKVRVENKVNVSEALGQERYLRLGVNHVPASLHQLRLLKEP